MGADFREVLFLAGDRIGDRRAIDGDAVGITFLDLAREGYGIELIEPGGTGGLGVEDRVGEGVGRRYAVAEAVEGAGLGGVGDRAVGVDGDRALFAVAGSGDDRRRVIERLFHRRQGIAIGLVPSVGDRLGRQQAGHIRPRRQHVIGGVGRRGLFRRLRRLGGGNRSHRNAI